MQALGGSIWIPERSGEEQNDSIHLKSASEHQYGRKKFSWFRKDAEVTSNNISEGCTVVGDAGQRRTEGRLHIHIFQGENKRSEDEYQEVQHQEYGDG